MEFITKLQNKPEHIKKIILWLTIIIIAVILISFWLIISYQRIKKFPKEEFTPHLFLFEKEKGEGFIGQTNMSALKEQIENFSK